MDAAKMNAIIAAERDLCRAEDAAIEWLTSAGYKRQDRQRRCEVANAHRGKILAARAALGAARKGTP